MGCIELVDCMTLDGCCKDIRGGIVSWVIVINMKFTLTDIL